MVCVTAGVESGRFRLVTKEKVPDVIGELAAS
jgi:hypothetical protein